MVNKNFYYVSSLARQLAGTTAENYSDNDLLRDMNIVRQDMHAKVVANGKSSPYWDEAVLDLFDNEYEYPLPSPDDDKVPDEQYFDGMRTVAKVFVKFSPDGQYEELPYKNISSPLGDGQNSKKYYSIADNSLFIFPTPTKYVADGIIVHGVNNLRDVEIGSSEEKIFAKKLPSTAFETLALGIAVRYCRYAKRDFAEADKLEIEYEKEMLKIIKNFKARSVRIIEMEAVPPRFDLQ